VIFDALGALTEAEKNEIDQIVRIHFKFQYAADAGGAHTFGRFGLITITDEAMAIGGSSTPSPIGDSENPWMLNEYFETEVDQLVAQQEITRDVRVRRNIPQGNTLMFRLAVSGAASSVHWNVGMRILLRSR